MASPGNPPTSAASAFLLLLLIGVSACHGPDPQSAEPLGIQTPVADGWPLSCSPFPPREEIAECARRGTDGRIAVRPEVVAAEASGGSISVLVVEGEPYYALPSGVAARTLWFDNGPDPFSSGLARTVHAGKIGFIDRSLEEVVPPTWDFAFPFDGDSARVCTGCGTEPDGEHREVAGGSWGYVDRSGKVVVPVAYDRDDLPPPPAEQ